MSSRSIEMRKPVYIYGVYEDGQLIFEGDYEAVGDKFGVQRGSITACGSKGHKLKNKYDVKRIACKFKPVKKPKKKKEEPKVEPKAKELDFDELMKDPYFRLKWHLKHYGNTSVLFDPVAYLPQLYDDGLDCRVIERPNLYQGGKSARQRKGKKNMSYYVEVVNAKGKRESV